MDEIRVGLFGLGNRGRHWLRLLQKIDGFRITAIGDIFPTLHEKGLSELGDRKNISVYTNYEDLLSDENVAAIALCVRCKEQGAMAAQALELGKHVHSEVPAAHTIKDCWRIVAAVERSGLVYQLAEQVLYAGFVLAWSNLVKEGALGHISYFEADYIGYKGTLRYHQDWSTGDFVYPDRLKEHPAAKPTGLMSDPMSSLAHELGPALKILDDRVVRVVGMGTRPRSYGRPELEKSDVQVALMHTEKATILRMVSSFTQKHAPERDHHYYQIIGTEGSIESGRSLGDPHLFWLADYNMHGPTKVKWGYQRTDAPPGAAESGHSGMDYYVHIEFRDAILQNRKLEFDVYKAINTAAPAIAAVESIKTGSVPIDVVDFRPNTSRPAGQLPKTIC